MEHNARNVLPTIYKDERGSVITSKNLVDGFFPFDPYVLKRSLHKIKPFYVEYQGAAEEFHTEVHEADIDDFLCEQNEAQSSKSRFSYSSSPGFKYK